MPEIADIFRQYGPEYLNRYGDRMPESHKRAIWDIIGCRTEMMGGHVYLCQDCSQPQYSYHSCQNRHCPKCMNDRTEKWLEKQKQSLLPTGYFLITFTLPEALQQLCRSNQKQMYTILFRCSAQSLKNLSADQRFVGAMTGFTSVLHTWRRDMQYHPHVHCIVPAGGYDIEQNRWLPAHEKFFVPVLALSTIFRAKVRDELKKTDLFNRIPRSVWEKDWVVHSKPVGDGNHVLEYVAPYVYRVAISNNRIISINDDQVTFRYKESGSNQWKTTTSPAMEFIRRFLQHVLPKGFMKIRRYGFLSPVHKKTHEKIQTLLSCMLILLMNPLFSAKNEKSIESIEKAEIKKCRFCGGKLVLMDTLYPVERGPPSCVSFVN